VAGLAALFLPRTNKTFWRCGGVVLLAMPFMLGAPQPEVDGFSAFSGDALVQMHALSAQFVLATALATAVYWLSLGLFSNLVVARWVRPFVASFGIGAKAVEGAL
jgi:predicted cobalt transporter CbtA